MSIYAVLGKSCSFMVLCLKTSSPISIIKLQVHIPLSGTIHIASRDLEEEGCMLASFSSSLLYSLGESVVGDWELNPVVRNLPT